MQVSSIYQRLVKSCHPLKLSLLCVFLTLFHVSAVGAIDSLRQQAEQGDAAASHALAERYLHGDGVEQDDAQAAYWYRRAADLGYHGPEPDGIEPGNDPATPDTPATTGRRIVSPPLDPATDPVLPVIPMITDSPIAIDESEADESERPEALPQESADAPAEPDERVTVPKRDITADEANISTAEQAVESGDYAGALELLYPEAIQDNPAAQTLLGDLYMQGLGVQQSRERAMLWYRRAARHDYARAQFNLGNMYFMGEGVLQDDDAALEWYGLAAVQGHEGARNNLHNLERRRETRISPLATRPPPPVVEMQEEVLTAIETESETVARESIAAADETVTEEPLATATVPIAPGRIVTPPIHTLEPIAPIPDATAGEEPAEVGATEELIVDLPIVEPDTAGEPAASADRQVIAAVEPDNARELYERGQQLALGDGTRRDPAAAIEYYRRAAELGYAPAQYRLGAAYHYGEGVSKDPAQAASWYRRAAEQGFTMAQRNLGNLYLRGEGVAQDKVQALAWLSLVAVRGSDIDRQQQAQLAGSLSEEEQERARELAAEYGRL